jgi:hypothetical protein
MFSSPRRRRVPLSKPHLLSIALLAALPLAGCISQDEAPAAAPLPPPAVPPPADVPVSLDGSLAGGVMACTPLSCPYITPIGTRDRRFDLKEVAGDLARVNLTLAWDASSPFMEELTFGVFTCGEGCTDASITNLETASGPSPLTLDVAGFEVPEGETFHVFITSHSATPMVYASPTTPQDFHVEGTLTPAPVDGAPEDAGASADA